MTTAPTNRADRSLDSFLGWQTQLANAVLVVAGLFLLVAGAFFLTALTGDGWAWLGYLLAAGIAIFEVPAVVLAVVTLRISKAGPRRGRVTAVSAALLAACPLLLWMLWGINS